MFPTTILRSMRKHEPMNWVPSWLLIFSMFMYVFNVCIINLFWAVRWTWSNWCHVCHELYGPLGPLGPSITEAALCLPHLPKTSASRGPWVAYRFSFSWSFSLCRLDENSVILYMFFFATPCDLESSLPRQYNGRVRPKKRVWWPSKWHQLLWIRSIKSVVTIKQDGTPSPPKKGSGSNAGWVQKIPPVMFHPTLRPRRQHIKQSICQYV